MNGLIFICLPGFLIGALAQGTLDVEGGSVRAIGATIQASFSGPISGAQTVVWKFNNTAVCSISIPTGTFVAASSCDSSTTYFNDNSEVVSADVNSSGVLEAVFLYSNIKEDYLVLSVVTTPSNIQYGEDTPVTVQGCPVQSNANSTNSSCDSYNCTTTFFCKDNYSGEDVNATCQANATWNNNIICSPNTPALTSTQSTESESTTTDTSATENSPGTDNGIKRQRCVCENNESIYSGERPADSSVIAFSVCLGLGVIAVIIVIWKISLKKCIVIIWVALFYTISFCLIIVGIVLTAVYEDNCCGNNTERYIGIACGVIGIIGCVVGIALHIIGELKKAAFLYCCCCRADAKDDDESTYSCVCGGKVLCKCGCSKSSGTCCCCCIVTENQVDVEKREYEMGSTNNSPPATA